MADEMYNTLFGPAVPNSPTSVIRTLRMDVNVFEFEAGSSSSCILSITISHCSLGRKGASVKLPGSGVSSSSSESLHSIDSRGSSSAFCFNRSMSSEFFPLALRPCRLHSFTSWSRLRELSAGEWKRICVVVDMARGRTHSVLVFTTFCKLEPCIRQRRTHVIPRFEWLCLCKTQTQSATAQSLDIFGLSPHVG